ncbi:MAG: LPS assembly protein LptD [Pseudomonadota bacterium]
MLLRSLIFSILLVASPILIAEDSRWRQCGERVSPAAGGDNPRTVDQVSDTTERAHLFNIDQDMHADRVQYFEKGRKAVATGNVLLRDSDYDMTAEKVEYNTDTETAVADKVRYWYYPSHGSGTAKKAEKVSENVVRLEEATYSTCDFSDRDWEVKANRVTLDRDEGVGYGRNVVARFKGVPIFYTPWLSFPLNDERKTGFLAPVFGTSSSSGIELQTPFYWNLAPNYDALITPRYLSKRGVQANLATRLLTQNSFSAASGSFLDDRDADDDRYLVSLTHQHTFTQALRFDGLYNKASDDQYFEDLGDSIGITSTQRLERRGDILYEADHFGGLWNGLLRAQQFQIVDQTVAPENFPYKRLPQILISNAFNNLPMGFEFNSESEWVSFEQDERVEGSRLNLFTEFARPFAAPGYFLTPSMRWRYTNYDLSNSDEDPINTDFPNSVSRTLPSFSVDSGLIFERDLVSTGYRQTLEPRAYYLYTPFRDQDDIPRFDTSEFEFSYGQLFRDNRFTGPDRIGDANQLTLALTTRYLNQNTGEELARASIGQIYYFSDRDVTLDPDDPDQDSSDSEIAGELQISLNDRWRAIASAIYDTEDTEYDRVNTSFQYRTSNNFIINTGYRFRRTDFSQTDLSFVYPITEKWRTVGRWIYDFRDKRDLDLLGGLEYDTCCWKFRVVARRFVNETDSGGVNSDNEGDYNNSIQFQLTLKGFTSVGSNINDELQQGIRGYEDRNTFVY